MSKFNYIEIESKLSELEKHSRQKPFLENKQIRILTRKRGREREKFETIDNYLEKYEKKLLFAMTLQKKKISSLKKYIIFFKEKN